MKRLVSLFLLSALLTFPALSQGLGYKEKKCELQGYGASFTLWTASLGKGCGMVEVAYGQDSSSFKGLPTNVILAPSSRFDIGISMNASGTFANKTGGVSWRPDERVDFIMRAPLFATRTFSAAFMPRANFRLRGDSPHLYGATVATQYNFLNRNSLVFNTTGMRGGEKAYLFQNSVDVGRTFGQVYVYTGLQLSNRRGGPGSLASEVGLALPFRFGREYPTAQVEAVFQRFDLNGKPRNGFQLRFAKTF